MARQAQAADYTDICDAAPTKKRQPQFNGSSIPSSGGFQTGIYEVTIDGVTFENPNDFSPDSLTLPASSFLLSDGNIEPIYPDFVGAFVYDLQYKRWGKMNQLHKVLLDYSPINTHAGDAPIPRDIFSVVAGCVLADGTIAIFDSNPSDATLRYGKIGYYRLGFTVMEECVIHFREPAYGSVTIEGSLDGRNPEASISKTESFSGIMSHIVKGGLAARWYNIALEGSYDLKHLEFRGYRQGKR